MKLITLDQVEFTKIVDCFNLSFSDYFIKFVVDEAYLKKRWHGANMDLNLSAGILDGDDLVGFIAIGIGERNGKKHPTMEEQELFPLIEEEDILLRCMIFCYQNLKLKVSNVIY